MVTAMHGDSGGGCGTRNECIETESLVSAAQAMRAETRKYMQPSLWPPVAQPLRRDGFKACGEALQAAARVLRSAARSCVSS